MAARSGFGKYAIWLWVFGLTLFVAFQRPPVRVGIDKATEKLDALEMNLTGDVDELKGDVGSLKNRIVEQQQEQEELLKKLSKKTAQLEYKLSLALANLGKMPKLEELVRDELRQGVAREKQSTP